MDILTSLTSLNTFIPAALTMQRYSQQQRAVDLATRRLAFWESYARVALSVNSSDPTIRKSIEKEVYEAIQQVRSGANAELMRVSWSQLIRENRAKPKPLKTSDKVSYWLATIGACFFSHFV